MKRLLGLLAATTLLATSAVAVGSGPVGAAATTTPVVAIVQTIDLPTEPEKSTAMIYLVHGLNLDGQNAQTDGGTAVTVCADGAPLIADFQFGDIIGPIRPEKLAELDVTVFLGAGADCTGTDPIISQTVIVPDVTAAALVATAGPDGELQLLPVVLDVTTDDSCFPKLQSGSAPQGRPIIASATLAAVHAAAAPPVTVEAPPGGSGTLEFGEAASGPVVPGTYEVTVLLGATPIVGPVDLELAECTATVVYVVGNQPIAGAPVTPTTAPAPAAAAVTAAPAFTG